MDITKAQFRNGGLKGIQGICGIERNGWRMGNRGKR